jgi:glyoxylase-like metal-dependent hydrolase (beta-lactamase superfamily II)
MTNPPLDILDVHQFGIARAGAVYLLRTRRPALIESGTAASHVILRRALRLTSPEYVFVTHIHLDHAGGAGHLAAAFPHCKVVVHERGCRHLADPTQLIAGVRAASSGLFALQGDPLPVPERQLLPVRGGETFDLGDGIRLQVIASPGHAPHHVCFVEEKTGILFTGDAVGHWRQPVHAPLTVPPRFDLEASLRTLAALQRLRPSRLAFTHFGIAGNAMERLTHYKEELHRWFGLIGALLRDHSPRQVVETVLAGGEYASLGAVDREILTMCVRGAIGTLQGELPDEGGQLAA